MCNAYFDPQCESVAQRFLAEAPEHKDADVLDLAMAIQRAIEDWWDARRFVTDWQDETLPAPSNPLLPEE